MLRAAVFLALGLLTALMAVLMGLTEPTLDLASVVGAVVIIVAAAGVSVLALRSP